MNSSQPYLIFKDTSLKNIEESFNDEDRGKLKGDYSTASPTFKTRELRFSPFEGYHLSPTNTNGIPYFSPKNSGNKSDSRLPLVVLSPTSNAKEMVNLMKRKIALPVTK
jgi:hypothetical protein